MLRLERMTPQEYDAFTAWMTPHYARENVRVGRWSSADADRLAQEEIVRLLPQGRETPDHTFYSLRSAASGEHVGDLWYALQAAPPHRTLFVYWIGIDEAHRRKGYAQEAFARMEEVARREGADRIALNVFGDNPGARALYLKAGFHEMAIFMAKRVAPRPP